MEDNNVEKFLKEVEGKSLDELLSAGRAKLASMPAAGAAPAGGGGGAAAGGAAADAGGKPEEKKVEEESEEEVFSSTSNWIPWLLTVDSVWKGGMLPTRLARHETSVVWQSLKLT